MSKFREIVHAELVNSPIDDDQYFKTQNKKKQIVLHHTASGKGVEGDIRYWNNTKSKISTCVLINWDGKIYQVFSSKFWGWHLGVRTAAIKAATGANITSTQLNQRSIGVEIDNWGGLKQGQDGLWYAWPAEFGTKEGKKVAVPESAIQFYPNGFKGYEAFEKYTMPQLVTTMELMEYWHYVYGIPVDYNPNVWDIMTEALSGEAGTFTHNSYRKDKSDVHPQPELIKAWQDLTLKLRK